MGKRKIIAGIYCITNILNNKKYVGHSNFIGKRWDNHKYKLRRGTHTNEHLQAAWDKYGESSFVFSILEKLPTDLSREEYEVYENKWVLHFKSHLNKHGYNSVLPGTIPIKDEGGNENKIGKFRQVGIILINLLTRETKLMTSIDEASSFTGVKSNRISDCCSYWTLTKSKYTKRSYHGFIFIREKDYDPEFDYISFHKPGNRVEKRKTWRDYPCNLKKEPKDIIPIEQRKLKRVPIIAVDILTGEEKYYRMIRDAYKEFVKCKIYKCINSPFGKHQHRGYYFKRAEI